MKFLQNLIDNIEPNNWWKEYRVFCNGIKNIDINLYIVALPSLLKKLENNYAVRDFRVALETAAKNNSLFGKEVFEKTLQTKNIDLYCTLTDVLSGLFYSDEKFTIDKIKSLILNDNINISKTGIQTLAKIDLSNSSAPKGFITWIEKKINKITNDETLAKLWSSVFFLVRNKRKELKNADSIIDKLSNVKVIEIQLELIYFLEYNMDLEKEMHLFEKYLPLLLHIDIEYIGAYRQLVYRLESVAKINLSLVIDFLTDWVNMRIEHARKIECFSYLLNTLIDDFYKDFQSLYTNWLNKDNPNFHIAIFEMNRVGEIRDFPELTVSESVIKDFSDYDIEYITYKILAYVYDKDTSISLLYSILEYRVKNKVIVDFLSDIFVNHLIFNYYSTIELLNLKKKTVSIKLKKIIIKIVKEGGSKYRAYSDLKILKEFAPSEQRLKYYDKIQNKNFRKSYKENETNSTSFLSRVKNLHYRSGNSSFAMFAGEYSQKMTPSLISHSSEMPRGEFIDPIGQAKKRLLWQNFKRRL